MRILSFSAFLLGVQFVFSGEVNNLIQFQSNTTAKSSEVNQNFNAIKDAVNDNNSRIGDLEQFRNNLGGSQCQPGEAVTSIDNSGNVSCQSNVRYMAVTYHAACFSAVNNPSRSVPRTTSHHQYLSDQDGFDSVNLTYCPITIPAGSKIVKIVAIVYDNTADTENISVHIYKGGGIVGSTPYSSNAVNYQNLEIDLTGSPVIVEEDPENAVVLSAQYSSDQKGMGLRLQAVTVYYEYDPSLSITLP